MEIYHYNYYDSNTPTFNQMCKYKNILPIEVSNSIVNHCINFLNQNQKHYKLLLEDYLETIYDFAGCLCDGIFLVTGQHQLANNINEFWNRNNNWYDFYNPHTDKKELLFDNFNINRENTIIENFNIKIPSNELKNSSLAINIIYEFQKILNPNKYQQSINEIIPSNKQINIITLLYYISNQLVQLSHDVIYAVNQSINSKTNIIDNIIRKLSWILELTAESILDNGLIIISLKSNNNIILDSKNRSKFKQTWYNRRYRVYDSSYERFSVYFQNIDEMLIYYKSKYHIILSELEENIKNIKEVCNKKSSTIVNYSILESHDRYKDTYEILTNWLETTLEWYSVNNHYEIGKLLLNNNKIDNIITQCKSFFQEQFENFDTFYRNNKNINTKIVNEIHSQIKQLYKDTLEKIKNV